MAIGNVTPVRPLLFWSQKVLPLVYDESLSYYEVLGKVVEKLNEMIEYNENVTVATIKDYIYHMFANTMYDASNERITIRTGWVD